MLKRKIEDKFLEWKNDKNHNPLIVKGCRQCGKTYSVLNFAKNNYKNVVYLNFFENPEYMQFFSYSLDIDTIVMYITSSLGTNAVFELGKTCLILDEIQECPQARAALKFFKLDGRYDVIGTGSLLGISGYKNSAWSVPVGYESIVEMYPLDFEEFLWANGISNQVVDVLRNCLSKIEPVPVPIHNRMRGLLLQYCVVGGMPKVVETFLETHHMGKVLSLQRSIVDNYKDDMVKYSEGINKACIRDCFESIPKQLAKENKKFQYSVVKKGASASKYEGCLQWIEDAGIIKRCYNLSITELPLDGNAIQDVFKVYMCDMGLLVSMLEEGTQADILQGNLLGYKGAIFENLVADMLIKMGKQLYYFHKDSGLEIDFIFRYKGECTLLEVKAHDGNTKSSKTILSHPEKYHVSKCIKLGDYNVGTNGMITTLPLYFGWLLTEVN